jgi:hypothetical protein
MQPGDDLQNLWMMFDHIKCVQGLTTMAYHIYDPVDYYKFMMIEVCDMQFEDTKAQCILWRKLNVVVEKKGSRVCPFSRGSW